MHTLKQLYKIGNGPSSSHTMGPKKATEEFVKRFPQMDYAKVELFGSLALTGKGHLTDYIIELVLNKANIKHDIEFNYLELPPHPNTMTLKAYKNNEEIGKLTVYSIGGGAIKIEGEPDSQYAHIYPHTSFREIKEYCIENNISLSAYVYRFDEDDIHEYLEKIYKAMIHAIERGLSVDPNGEHGTLHGDLRIKRKAKMLYTKKTPHETNELTRKRELYAYAYAVSEENADGGEIVTAPTCGASGVLPAVIHSMEETKKYSHDCIIDGLAVAGLIGNLVKFNGSISGAEAGCQAEVGTACAMAAAFVSSINGDDISHIEQAAEIALEHHLGLTCDPINGYVQIPCIERNAVAAVRAIDASTLANLLNSQDSKISFDLVVKTMLETGKDLTFSYRETSQGGLAKNYSK